MLAASETWRRPVEGFTRTEGFTPLHYTLRCTACGVELQDDGFHLECAGNHGRALLATNYRERRLIAEERETGIYRYKRWLPVRAALSGCGQSITYRSEAISRFTGLAAVWVSFNGYWPERGATWETGTFKELESYSVLARLPESSDRILVVASAGNTAAAFARTCSLNHRTCILVIPETALPMMRFAHPISETAKLIVLRAPADYADAIELSNRIASQPQFFKEGGAFNVARRDGLGTVLLHAVEAMGQMPDAYFQAVGSGTGAIAVHEAATRLVEDGRFGSTVPRQMLSQNLPFAPIFSAWKAGRRQWPAMDTARADTEISQTRATVLCNRKPPYDVTGGVYDILTESRGDMMTADNAEVQAASECFESLEGIDIEPSAAVAFATLLKAAHSGRIEPKAVVLLNITGGGRRRRALSAKLETPRVDLFIDRDKLLSDATRAKVHGLL